MYDDLQPAKGWYWGCTRAGRRSHADGSALPPYDSSAQLREVTQASDKRKLFTSGHYSRHVTYPQYEDSSVTVTCGISLSRSRSSWVFREEESLQRSHQCYMVEHSLKYLTGCTGHRWWLSGGLLKWQERITGPSFPPHALLYSTSSTFLVIFCLVKIFLTSLAEADSWTASSKWRKDKVTIVLRVKEYGLFSPGWGMCWLYVCVKRPSIRFRPGPSGL